jgi:hypothetical protein
MNAVATSEEPLEKWWWADYVDERLAKQLAECRQWTAESPDAPFEVSMGIPMEDDDGSWVTWLNITPVEHSHGEEVRVLVDHARSGFMFATVLRRARAPHPIHDEYFISRAGDPPGLVLHRFATLFPEWVTRPATWLPPPGSRMSEINYLRQLADALRKRRKGRALASEPDGVMTFIVTL